MSETIFDVAVIGGGVSGVYTGWRLLSGEAAGSPALAPVLADNRGRLNVGLFEGSDRIGGRLYSVTLPGAPHLPVELGGMRFLNLHRRAVGLIEHFGLEHRRLEVDDPQLTNLNYLRGRHFAIGDWKRPAFLPPYRLDGIERGRAPGDLIIQVCLKYKEAADAGRLYDRGFWNLLYQELSAEGYALAKDAGGYWTILNNWNAGAAIPFFLEDFDPSSEYRALRKGFQALPLTLADEFMERGGTVHLTHRLHRLDLGADGLIRLTFDSGDPDGFARYRRVRNPVVHQARHVVLAMPRRAIELLHPDSFLFASEQFQDDLKTVLAQPAFKIFAAYPEPWWERVRGITVGRSVTDLPIRQCYYWGTEGEQPEGDPRNRNSILMASYNDGTSVEFWSGLARTPSYEPPAHLLTAAAPDQERVRPELRAPAGMVTELQEQVRELHGVAPGVIPPPYEAVYQDWGREPYGGGWHFWKIHARPHEVMPRIQRPVEKANLYICGEAWSTQQGWVEGALQTADAVLEGQLGISPPPWLAGPREVDLRHQAERVRSILPA
jgi:lysine 2-monooxygenase